GLQEAGVDVLMIGDPPHAAGVRPGDPNGRVWLLVRSGPGVDVAIMPKLTLPVERLVRRPGVHDEVMGLLKTVPGKGWVGVGGMVLGRHTTDKAADEAPLRHTIEERHLLGHPHRVVAVRYRIAQQ